MTKSLYAKMNVGSASVTLAPFFHQLAFQPSCLKLIEVDALSTFSTDDHHKAIDYSGCIFAWMKGSPFSYDGPAIRIRYRNDNAESNNVVGNFSMQFYKIQQHHCCTW